MTACNASEFVLLVIGDGLKTQGLVEALVRPAPIAADAAALLDLLAVAA